MMSKSLKLASLASVLAMGAFSCSHGALDQKIDQEVAQETSVKTRSDLIQEASSVLDNASDLSAEQRDQLKALRSSVTGKMDQLYSQNLKLRSVLIKDLVAKDYNEDEVELIKARIKYNEDKRLTLIFEAVEKAKGILGHALLANRHIVEEFMEGGREGRE